MTYIIIIFLIITASLSFIAAIGQLIVKERKLMHYFLSAFLFCLTILQLQAAALITGIGFTYPVLFFFNTTALYLIGALRFISYFLITLRMEEMPGKKFMYFIPSCIAMIFDVHYITLPETDKLRILTDLFSGTSLAQGMPYKVLIFGAGVQATVYWGIVLVKLMKSWISGKEVILSGTSIAYSIVSIIAMCLLCAGYILPQINLIIIVSVLLGLMVIGTFLIHQMSPEFLQLTVFPNSKKRYSRTRLAGIKTDDLHRRIMELIDVEKIYADENVSLTDCADELSITPHQLSEFLNERMNCNFYTFINRHRIKEAIRLLEQEPDRTILSIAHMVGFNSKSSFYDSFSRFMGMTPNQYRSKYLKMK